MPISLPPSVLLPVLTALQELSEVHTVSDLRITDPRSWREAQPAGIIPCSTVYMYTYVQFVNVVYMYKM